MKAWGVGLGEGGATVTPPATTEPTETPAEPTEETPAEQTEETPKDEETPKEETPKEETPAPAPAPATETAEATTGQAPAAAPAGAPAVAPVKPRAPTPAGAPAKGAVPEPSLPVPTGDPRQMQAAQQMQMGTKQADALGAASKIGPIVDAVNKQKAALDNYMHALARPDNGLTGDQVMERARAANPAMGDYVQNLLDGAGELTPAQSGKQTQSLAASLAKRIDPTWNLQKRKEEREREKEARMAQIRSLATPLSRMELNRENLRAQIGKNVGDMNYLLTLAQKLEDRGLMTDVPRLYRALLELRRLYGGDPDVQAFETQLGLVQADVGRILYAGASGTGAVYPVSAQKEMRDLIKLGLNFKQVKAVVNTIKQDYSNRLGPMSGEINKTRKRIADLTGTPTPAPLSDEDVNRQINAEATVLRNGKFFFFYDGAWHDDETAQ